MSKRLRSGQLQDLLNEVKEAVVEYKRDSEGPRSNEKFKLLSVIQRFLESELSTSGEVHDERFNPVHIKKQLRMLEAVIAERSGGVSFGSKIFSSEELINALHGERSRRLYANFCALHGLDSIVPRSQVSSSINRAGEVIGRLFNSSSGAISGSPRKERKPANLLLNQELLEKVQHQIQAYNNRKSRGPEVKQKIRFLTQLQYFLTYNGSEPYTIDLFQEQMLDFFDIYRLIKDQPSIGSQILTGASFFVDGKKITFGRQEFDMIQLGLILHGKICNSIILDLGRWSKDLARALEPEVVSSVFYPIT